MSNVQGAVAILTFLLPDQVKETTQLPKTRLWTLDFGHWTNLLERDFTLGYHHRRSPNANFFNRTRFTFNIEVYATGTLHEIALLDHKLVTPVHWFNSGNAMMDQVRTQSPACTSSRRVLWNVVGGSKQTRVGSRLSYLQCFTAEHETSGAAGSQVDLRKQTSIHLASSQVSNRPHRNGEKGESGGDDLDGQCFIQIFSGQTQSP